MPTDTMLRRWRVQGFDRVSVPTTCVRRNVDYCSYAGKTIRNATTGGVRMSSPVGVARLCRRVARQNNHVGLCYYWCSQHAASRRRCLVSTAMWAPRCYNQANVKGVARTSVRTAVVFTVCAASVAFILTAVSAIHADWLYVGRELWTTTVDPNAPLNTERVLARGWPVCFLFRTPIGWRFAPEDFALEVVLAFLPSMVLVSFYNVTQAKRKTAK